MDRFQGNLEKLHILTYRDRVRLRQAGYHRQILFDREGNDRISELIRTNSPLMVSRLGSVELSCLRFYLEKRQNSIRPYTGKIRTRMSDNAGFFPVDDRSLDAFSELYLRGIGQVDLMGVWFNPYEDVICNTCCPGAELADFDCLEPFRFTKPWSRMLAGRTVLVVHPFAKSIQNQYREKRRLLFGDPEVLPDFELKTISAVQSIAGAPVNFATWFDAYRSMCDELERTGFDVCIIGAGAYGLPLAAFAKQLGRQALHLGGVTQILFGIKGRRWEQLYPESTAQLFNEHWVRPLPSETPPDKDRVENGCYW